MAITKIGIYRNPPKDITDFQGINELLMAYARDLDGQGMLLTEWTNNTDFPKLAMGSYLFHGGVSYMVDAEDYEIGEPSDGVYYLKIEADNETLAVSWISSLTGYAWNSIYNGLYHPNESQILPYRLVIDGAVVEKWKITNLAQGGGYNVVNSSGHMVQNRTDSANFIGMVAPFASINAPDGWLKCDGSLVSKINYAKLYAVIGNTFGEDGSFFNLPDLRGEFIRGLDDGRGVDANRDLGSEQSDLLKSHTHSIAMRNQSGTGSSSYPGPGQSAYSGGTATTRSTGGSESRPRNVALLYCIKY